MKKSLSILLFVVAGFTVFSQAIEDYSNPQRYWFWPFNPDSITVERPTDAWEHWGCYYCERTTCLIDHPDIDNDTVFQSHLDTFPYVYEGLIVSRHDADMTEPKTIYGVAIPVWEGVQQWDDTAAWVFAKDTMFTGFIAIGDFPRRTDTMDMLFHTLELVQIQDSVHFKMGVNVWTDNLFKFVPNNFNFTCPDSIYRVLEVYFDQPHIMTDSFWVGQRLYIHETDSNGPNQCCPRYGGMAMMAPTPPLQYPQSTVWFYGLERFLYFSLEYTFYNDLWYLIRPAENLRFLYPGGFYEWGRSFPIIAPPPCFVIPPLKIRNVRNTSVDIMWDNPVSSLYRRIELGPAGFTPGTGIIIDNFYGDSIHFQNLAPDFEYEVHVSSFCSTDSVYTEPTVAFFSTAMNCDKVQNFAVADITDSTAILFWRMTSLSDYSELEYGPQGFSHGDGRLVGPIHSLGTGNCSRMLDSLQPGTAYTAYARTWCDYTEMFSDWERVDFTTGVNPNDTAGHDTTSIASAAQQRITLVPNPATNSVTITAEAEILSVEAYNVKGQRIAITEAHGTTQKLDTSSWPNGTYTITIRTAKGTVTRKLVINK